MPCGEYQCQAILFFKWTCHSRFGRMENCALIVCFKSMGKKMPGGVDNAMVTSSERRPGLETLPGVKMPPHSSLPPSTILYLCLQEDGGATGHEYTMGTVVWTLRSRKLKTGFHHTLDRKLLDAWRSAWAETWYSKRRKQKEQNNEEAAVWWSVCVYLCIGHGMVPPEDPGGGDVSH